MKKGKSSPTRKVRVRKAMEMRRGKDMVRAGGEAACWTDEWENVKVTIG